MLTSREVMRETGISRATLNNYIALGILPRPIVGVAGPGSGSVRRIGYFEDFVIDRIHDVQRLKREGLAMTDIAARFTGQEQDTQASAMPSDARVANGEREASARTYDFKPRASAEPVPAPAPNVIMPGRPLRLTVDDIPHPSYMVNNNFELEWWNTEAANDVFRRRQGLEAESEARNVFRLLLEAPEAGESSDWTEVLRLHIGVAKNRLTASSFGKLTPQVGAENAALLSSVYEETDAIAKRHIMQAPVNLRNHLGDLVAYDLYATFFREGVLFTYLPRGEEAESLLDLLARREQVIRDLLKKRMPALTHLAVLVADLDHSKKLATELPPEEYFRLVNDIWGAMELVFRSYYGTHGKHLSDGLVYYFFPQPDCNYVMNAIHCARELQETMRRISREWQARRNLLNEFRLNIGLDEGHEWFGSFNTSTTLDFTVLGQTVDDARRLAQLAGDGSIMATKEMIGILNPEERARVHYGVRRSDARGNEMMIPETYAQVADLIDLSDPSAMYLTGIGNLAVAEIADVFTKQKSEDLS